MSPSNNLPPEEKKRLWLKAIVFLVAIGSSMALIAQTDLFNFFMRKERLLKFIDSLGVWGFVGFIALQVLQVVAAPIPGEVTGLLGGFLYGPFLGILLSTIGLTLGSYLAFFLSRAFGRPLVERLVDGKTMDRFDYLLHHKGSFLIFLLFLIPGFPKDYLCYILGLGHLTTIEFLTIATTGRLLGTALLTIGGNFLRNEQYLFLFFLSGVAVVFIFLAVAYKDKLERLFHSMHKKDLERK